MARDKTRQAFDYILALISIFGFVALALKAFTLIDLGPWSTGILMLLAGGGLLIEGELFTIRRWTSNGLQGNEVPFVLSIVMGGFTIIVGILSFPFFGLDSVVMDTIVGIVASFAAVLIILQVWVFK